MHRNLCYNKRSWPILDTFTAFAERNNRQAKTGLWIRLGTRDFPITRQQVSHIQYDVLKRILRQYAACVRLFAP